MTEKRNSCEDCDMTQYIKLGELISKAKVERCGENKYPVLSMTMHNGLMFQSERFDKQIASQDCSKYLVVKRNQLVEGFPIDEAVLSAQTITDIGIVSPAYKIWDIKTEKIVPEYLERALRSERSIQYYKGKLRGSTARRRTISDENFLNLEIRFRKLEDQKKIIEILNKVHNVLSKKKAKLENLDKLVKARFVEMFGDPVGNDYYWKQTKLKEVSTKIGSGATPRGGRDSYCSEGISLIRSLNVYDGKFEYKDLAHISNEQAKKLNNVTVNKNDILINITGASVARTCIVPEDVLPARVNQHVSIIRCKADILNPVFINRMFLSDSYKNQLLNIGESGGATRQAITKDQLESLTIIVPPIKLQNQFAAFVQKTDKSKAVIQESIDKTQMLFDSLMQEYFS